MRSMQRRFGKLLPRSEDDNAVSQLLSDFEHADSWLSELTDAAKAWHQSWMDILRTQKVLIRQFQTMYEPILGHQPDAVTTSAESVQKPFDYRAARLQVVYQELEEDLGNEIREIQLRVIDPTLQLKGALLHMRKNIKRREDCKLDFERYRGRRDAILKKSSRSAREDAALAKHESDLQKAKQEYERADSILRSYLPGVLSAVYSIIPDLLSAKIIVGNTIFAHLYTQLHTFCEEEGFPSPPPPMNEVIAAFNETYHPVQKEFELKLEHLTGNPKTRQYYSQAETQRSPLARKPSALSATLPNTAAEDVSPASDDRPRISSVPSQSSLAMAMPNYKNSGPSPSFGEHLGPVYAPAGPNADYFSRNRVISTSPNSFTSAVALESKKKPPPPPPKRIPSRQDFWVTVLYDFSGQGQGDLDIREGDRIRVTKKTDSLNDWWEGELNGVAGSFPANYCQA